MSPPLWGYSLHGLYTRGDNKLRMGEHVHGFGPNETFSGALGDRFSYMFNGARTPMPGWGPGCVHLLEMPGIDDLDLTAEQRDAEQAAGRNWLHYGLINGVGKSLFGYELNGWVCIDSQGKRWHIKSVGSPLHSGSLQIDQPLHVALEVRPFGYLATATPPPVLLEFTLADIGQITSDPALAHPDIDVRPVLSAIHPQGREALVALMMGYGFNGFQSQQDTLPAGWLCIQLTGDGPNFDLDVSVLYSREQALGEFEEDIDVSPWQLQSLQLEFDYALEDNRFVATPTGELKDEGLDNVQYGHRHLRRKSSGRVCLVNYNPAGERVTMTADIELAIEVDWPPAELLGVTGTLWSEGASAVNGGTLTGSVRRTATDVLTARVSTYRDGALIETAEWESSRTMDATRTTTYGGDGNGYPSSNVYWGADPPYMVVSAGLGATLGEAPAVERFSINGSAVWEWESDSYFYGYLNLPTRPQPFIDRPWVVGLLAEANWRSPPDRWIGYRVTLGNNHTLGFSWYRLGAHIVNPNNAWTPTYMKWHRYAATGADWQAPDWQPDSPIQGFNYPAYNPKTAELVIPSGSERSGGDFI